MKPKAPKNKQSETPELSHAAFCDQKNVKKDKPISFCAPSDYHSKSRDQDFFEDSGIGSPLALTKR